MAQHTISTKGWSEEKKWNVFSEENDNDPGYEVSEWRDPEFAFIESEIESFEEKGWIYCRAIVIHRETQRYYEANYIEAYDTRYHDLSDLKEVFPHERTIIEYY